MKSENFYVCFDILADTPVGFGNIITRAVLKIYINFFKYVPNKNGKEFSSRMV